MMKTYSMPVQLLDAFGNNIQPGDLLFYSEDLPYKNDEFHYANAVHLIEGFDQHSYRIVPMWVTLDDGMTLQRWSGFDAAFPIEIFESRCYVKLATRQNKDFEDAEFINSLFSRKENPAFWKNFIDRVANIASFTNEHRRLIKLLKRVPRGSIITDSIRNTLDGPHTHSDEVAIILELREQLRDAPVGLERALGPDIIDQLKKTI